MNNHYHPAKKVYIYDGETYKLVREHIGIYNLASIVGESLRKVCKNPKGLHFDGMIYATVKCPYDDLGERAKYFSIDNDYIGTVRNKKQTAIELRGTRIYMYDAEDMTYLGKFDSLTEVSYDMDVNLFTLTAGTRRCPNGFKIGDAIYSRVKLHEGEE